MLHAVIMAGGSGTRFWPASTRLNPKQLLRLVGDRSMIQSTVDRISSMVPVDRQWVVTNTDLVEPIASQLPGIPAANLIGEPCKRDTAPCVGLAATLLSKRDPDAVMLVLPSDHVIKDVDQFQAAIQAGLKLIAADPARIVTFGIKPSYPAESFGYIERGGVVLDQAKTSAYDVVRFREKPNAITAAEYLAARTFYWNSGIFLWRADTILAALKTHAPEMTSHLSIIGDHVDRDDYQSVLDKEFAAIEGKSIDYAVMEHYNPIVVMEAPFDWDDVGSWQAISRMVAPDAKKNTVQGNHLGIDTTGCIIRSEGDHTIVTIGLDDLIIVQTKNATLVAPKAAEERVREAVKQLEARGQSELL